MNTSGPQTEYMEPGIRALAGILFLLISAGFFFLPSLNKLWFALSILFFIGLAGSGIVQLFKAGNKSRRGRDARGLAMLSSRDETGDVDIESFEIIHDELIERPNRVLVESRMAHDKGRADRSGTGFAVFCVSVDNLQEITHQQGFENGDKVMVAVAKKLIASLRPTDTVARWKEDELIILIPDLLTMDASQKVADKLSRSARRIFSGTTAENITFSIGVAVYPNDADTLGKLSTKAERALQLAKSRGHGNVQFASEPNGPMVWGT